MFRATAGARSVSFFTTSDNFYSIRCMKTNKIIRDSSSKTFRSLQEVRRLLYIVFIFSLVILFAIWYCMGGGSSKEMASPFLVMPQARHKATLIFLHGLGDTGQGWCDAFKQLGLQHIKCVCPTAPIQPVTLNAGFRMPSWFDIMALSPDGPEDETGIEKASKMLRDMISEEEKNGITSENVIVGGFSQGGAVALYTALTLEKRLAGIVGLSTWLPLHKRFPQVMKEFNRDIPMFQAHGTMDPLVPPQWGELTAQLVKTMTKNHSFKTYPMMHSSCQEEMDEVKNFLTSIVKKD